MKYLRQAVPSFMQNWKFKNQNDLTFNEPRLSLESFWNDAHFKTLLTKHAATAFGDLANVKFTLPTNKIDKIPIDHELYILQSAMVLISEDLVSQLGKRIEVRFAAITKGGGETTLMQILLGAIPSHTPFHAFLRDLQALDYPITIHDYIRFRFTFDHFNARDLSFYNAPSAAATPIKHFVRAATPYVPYTPYTPHGMLHTPRPISMAAGRVKPTAPLSVMRLFRRSHVPKSI